MSIEPHTHSAKTTFKLEAWDETTISDPEVLPRLTRAECAQRYQGDLEGTSILHYLITYTEDGTAQFDGHELVTGSLCGKTGSFVLRHQGSFAGGVARMRMCVVMGSATGDLAGLRGSAEFASPHAEEYELELGYSFGTG